MRNKYRIVLFPNDSSSAKEVNFSKFHLFLLIFSCLLIFTTITVVGVSVLTDYLHSFKLNSIRQERDNIHNSLKKLTGEVDILLGRIEELNQRGEQFRSDLSLEPQNLYLKNVGLGGSDADLPSNQNEFFFTEQELLSEIATDKLIKLKYMISAEEKSYSEIAAALEKQQEMLKYYPSIAPVSIKSGASIIPLSDRFGPRADPYDNNKMEDHKGLDIRGKLGTPVHATADGTVSYIDSKGTTDLGRYIKIDHNSKKYGYETIYGHLSKIEPGLKIGTTVKRWQKIGEIGETGHATGPHLHYQIELWGKPIDPEISNYSSDTFKPFYIEAANPDTTR